jgi:uncharacterized protein (DUF2336 family)
MAIQEFLAWLPAAPHSILARGAAKLGHAYLYGALTEPELDHARHALTLLAGHPSPLVRRALARTVASATNAPHSVVHTLANDRSDIAAIVLARSPLLSSAELVECAVTGDSIAQTAIALRPWVTAPVCAALAEVGGLKAVLALASNPGAELLEFSIHRMIERHCQNADLRAVLLARPNLPVSIRSDLACGDAVSRAARLTEWSGLPPQKAEWLIRDAGEQAIVNIAAEIASETREMTELIAHLRRSKQLTAALLLRGLLCGNRALFEFALRELTGLRFRYIAGMVAYEKSPGFAALYRAAGMPERLLPVFMACLKALRKLHCAETAPARLQGRVIDFVLRACLSDADGELDQTVALLRRLESEAARDEAHDFQARAAAQSQRPPLPSRPVPQVQRSPAPARGVVIDLEAFEAALMAA